MVMQGGMAFYESDGALAQYLWLHYSTEAEALRSGSLFEFARDFPSRCVSDLIAPYSHKTGRALDLGCAVGRASFDLSREMDEVVGIDSSALFIATATRVQRGEAVDYSLPIEGDLKEHFVATAPNGAAPGKIRFEQGDALHLRADLGSFDVVLAANILCRVSEPKKLLAKLMSHVRPGGLLAITTPSTWNHIFTPRENWLGGFESEHAPVCTLDGLTEALSPSFGMLTRIDMPLLIREHARKFELIIAEGTAWRRTADASLVP